MDYLRRWWPQIVLMIAGLFAFYGALSHPFLAWDDEFLILNNPLIRNFSPRIFTTYDPELYIPVTLLSFQINYLIAGLSPVFFHATNLALHLLNAVLVFLLAQKLLGKKWPAFFCALLFTVHPLNTEAVVWVSARKELLSATFLLGALLLYFHDRWKRSVVSAALAMMSKVTATVIPIILLAYHGLRLDERRWNMRRQWPYWGLALFFGIIGLFGKSEQLVELTLFERKILALQSFSFYVQKLFVPLQLSAIYPAPDELQVFAARTIVGLLLSVAGVAGIWLLRRRSPVAAWSLIFFWVTLIPSFLAYMKSGTVTLAADRYAYMPSIGFLLFWTVIIRKLAVTQLLRKVVATIVLILAVFFMYQSQIRTAVWANETTLFQNVLETYPQSATALNNVGNEELEAGNVNEARTLIERAIQASPDYADAHSTLGAIYGRLGDLTQAERELKKALELNPGLAQAHFNLAGIAYVRQQWNDAIESYEKTIEMQPYHADAYRQLANTHLRLGQRDEARDAYARAVEINPSFAGQFSTLDALLNE